MTETVVSEMETRAGSSTPGSQPLSATAAAVAGPSMVGRKVRMESKKLNFHYGPKQALWDITLQIPEKTVTAFIGPSGCGKSTFLRCLNRMNDIIPDTNVEGDVLLDGNDIYGAGTDIVDLRRRVGMVFQKSNPFPKSIFDNVAYGLKINGMCPRSEMPERVEKALRRAALWDEVKDRLDTSAMGLSGGQQQRLCIARAVAVEPEVLLMDEPCSALDPIATQRIEDLMARLTEKLTVIIVTHNLQQAARVSDRTVFMWMGELIEEGETTQMVLKPEKKLTEDYLTGRFG